MKHIEADAHLPVSQREADRSDVQEISPLQEQEFVAALLTVGGVADRAMVCRVQRCVRERAMEMVERRQRLRHSVGLTILGFSLLLLVLTPVVWSLVHLESESEMQFAYLIGCLFPVTLMALVLVFMRTRAGGDARRGGARQIDHRVASRLGSMVR
ncbi:MAG: hypothetical protein ACYDBH_07885 [Acidobacteriaceae bacterium]|jgi:hypothetical protein